MGFVDGYKLGIASLMDGGSCGAFATPVEGISELAEDTVEFSPMKLAR